MQQSIDMRDKLVEKIVQKRVDDLVNPDLKWDAGQLSRPSLASQSKGSNISLIPLPKSAAPSIASVPCQSQLRISHFRRVAGVVTIS